MRRETETVDEETQSARNKKSPASGPEEELLRDSAVDDFFQRFKQDLHRPKPGHEAIAAALQAVQRLALEVDAEDAGVVAETTEAKICPACGGQNQSTNRFCSFCGVPFPKAEPETAGPTKKPAASGDVGPQLPPGQHHYHHHYHHHYFSSSGDGAPAGSPDLRLAGAAAPAREPVRARASLGGPSLSRAEGAVRKLMQDWAQACNTKQLDDLVELYGTDALVMRPNVPAVRGASAIREFFFALVDSGFGDVQIEPLRTEVAGDFAYEAGRCTMLVPVAVSKRREERGKYLTVFARQAGEWRIVTDCWSSDLSFGAGGESGAGKPMQATKTIPGVPRKSS
jgi:ketosteroid isomerase-like protein